MRVLGRFVQEQVLHDDALHRGQRGGDMLGVGVRLGRVFALHIEGLEGAIQRGFHHVGNAQARLRVDRHAPGAVEQLARHRVRQVPVARQLVRERAHVAGALHVVLAAQRVHAHALAPDVARGHREVRDAQHHRAALAMLGDPQAVVDRAVATGGVQARGTAHQRSGHARDVGHGLGRVLGLRDEIAPALERRRLATLGHEGLVHQAFGHDNMGDGIDQRDVGARTQLQVVVRLHVRRAHQVDGARVGHDQLGALTQATLHARAEHRVAVGRVGADEQDDIGQHDRVKSLRARGLAQRVLEAIARGRMADTRAGVDVVGAQCRTDQLLDEEDFLVRAARRRDATDRLLAVLRLDAAELGGGIGEGLIPADLLPRVGDLAADHGPGDAVLVGRIAIGKAALDAGMAAVGLAIAARHHAHDFLALDLGIEGTADAAVGAGRLHDLLGLADLQQRLLGERTGRAGLDTGAAGDALGVHEPLVLAGNNLGGKAAAIDRQREGALHLAAGPHATRADDAGRRIEIKVRVALVDRRVQVVGAILAITGRRDAQVFGRLVQFAAVAGRTFLAALGMVGEIQLHDALAQFRELVALGAHGHALGRQRGAGGREAALAVDLDQAQAAGAEGLERIGGAELGDRPACCGRGAHDRRAGRHSDLRAVDGQGNRGAAGCGRTVIMECQ